MQLLTTSYVPGRAIEVVGSGLIFENEIVGLNIFRDILARIRDIVGGRTRSYDRVARAVVEKVVTRLAENAQASGADAVISLKVDVSYVGGSKVSMVQVAVVGTMVRYVEDSRGMVSYGGGQEEAGVQGSHRTPHLLG